DRWINVQFQKTVDWGFVWKAIIFVVVLAGSVLTVIVIWNRRLAGEITERKKIETDLEKSKQDLEAQKDLLQKILDNVDQAIALFDSDRRFVTWNKRYPEILNLSVGRDLYKGGKVYQVTYELAKKNVFGSGDPAQLAAKRLDQLWTGNIDTDISFGDERKYDVRSTVLSDGGLVITYTDVSERKKAEEAIKESEKRVQMILDSISTGVIVIDPENRLIVDVNPVAARMIGLTRDEIVGRTCHQFICPRDENDCPVIDLGQQVDNAERVLITASGEQIPILKTVTPVILGGKTHLLESFVDITERKQAEEKLKRNLKELELFNHLTISREEKMIELKYEINKLMQKMGKEEKYKIIA
ncbi:PAS domain-containing protein, partial [Thermodesulfobacteriota bacterium]